MAENTIADSLLAILRSQERKQETETSQSLQAMSLAIQSDQAERRLVMEERIAFDQKTEKLALRVEAKKQEYLGTLYTSYFQSDFLTAFKDFMEEGNKVKESALDARGSDGYQGLIAKYMQDGFSERDAKKIVASVYQYEVSGKTNSAAMQEVVDLFLLKRKDKSFLNAAVNSGIYSKKNFAQDINAFIRSSEFDIASLGLLAEGFQSNKGDLQYDYDYENFLSGGKLNRTQGKTQAYEVKKEEVVDEGKKYYTETEWASKIDGVSFDEDAAKIGQSGYRMDGDYVYDSSQPFDSRNLDKIEVNIDKAQNKLLNVDNQLNTLNQTISKRITEHDKGLAVYNESDRAVDSANLISLEKQRDVFSSYIQDNEVVLDKLEDEYSSIIVEEDLSNKSSMYEGLDLGGVEPTQAGANPFATDVYVPGKKTEPKI